LSSCGQNHHITGSNSEVSQPSVNVLDADQDGILNSMDADCDNDGIIDTNEIGLPPNANFNSINNGGSRPWLGNTSTNVSISTNTAYSATGSGTTFTLPNGRTVSYSSVRRLDKIRNSSFTFTFDSPIKANEFAFQIIDINNLGAPQLTVSVVTGDATTSDFTIVQSASSSVLSYNSTTGVISRSAGSARQHGVLVGLNEKTIQQINITLTGAGSGDFIAYNLISIEHGNLDTDLDQINDLCDLDSDNDGISDFTESGFLFTNADTNSDGFISKSESLAWLKLNVNPGITSGDANGDGLMDIFDVAYNTLLASGTFGTAKSYQ